MASLGFSTHWPKHMGGGPTHFVSKIWQSQFNGSYLNDTEIFDFFDKANDVQRELFNFKKGEHAPKLHTIRADEKNLWVPGRKIHMVVFNRTKNRFQFAPVLEVKSVQKIEISYLDHGVARMIVDGKDIVWNETNCPVEKLAKNDGFDSAKHFFQWFNEDFTGKIIHWTDLKY